MGADEKILDRKIFFYMPRLVFLATFTVIFIVALALRIWVSFNDFSLDEIWSLSLANGIASPWSIITEIHSYNNHYLNTFLLYILGNQENWVLYRIPSIIAGAGAVIAAGLVGSIRGRLEGVIAAGLIGFSYPLIHYSSEARGYSFEIFFGLLSYYLAFKYLENIKKSFGLLLSFCCVLGLLSHLTFIFCFGALFFMVRQKSDSWSYFIKNLIWPFIIPIIVFLLIFTLDISKTYPEGGLSYPLLQNIKRTLSLSLGGPIAGHIAFLVCFAAIFVFVFGLYLLYKNNSLPDIAFFSFIILSNIFFFRNFSGLEVRFLLVAVVFNLILLSYVVAYMMRQRNIAQTVAIGLLFLFIAGNFYHTITLIYYGRGQYLNALKHIAYNTQSSSITICSDHDFRNKIILAFYMNYLINNDKNIYYINKNPLIGFNEKMHDKIMTHIRSINKINTDNLNINDWPKDGPEWFIVHNAYVLDNETQPLNTIQDYLGNRYVLVKSWRCRGLSGMDWFIYHNLSMPFRTAY